MKSISIKLVLASLLFANVSFAEDTIIKTNMKDMRDSMNQINDGFFYNKKDKIMGGLKLLRTANKIFDTQADVKKYLPQKVKHMSGMSLNTAKRMNSNMDKLIKFVNKNKLSKASKVYSDIIDSCTSCHAIVRGW